MLDPEATGRDTLRTFAPDLDSDLARTIRRRAISAPEVGRRTHLVVSPSSVLAYVNGRTLPTPAKALAVAKVLGPEAGEELLQAWGFHELAEQFIEDLSLRTTNTSATDSEDAETHTLRYQGPRLTPDEETAIRNLLDVIRGRRSHA